MIGVNEAGVIDFEAVGFDKGFGFFHRREDDADVVESHRMPRRIDLAIFSHGFEGIDAAARNRSRCLNIFDENTLIGAGAAEIDDNIVGA